MRPSLKLQYYTQRCTDSNDSRHDAFSCRGRRVPRARGEFGACRVRARTTDARRRPVADRCGPLRHRRTTTVELIKSVSAAALRLAPSSRERAPTTSDTADGSGGSGGVHSEQLRGPGVPYDCVTVRVPPLICPEDDSLYMSYRIRNL